MTQKEKGQKDTTGKPKTDKRLAFPKPLSLGFRVSRATGKPRPLKEEEEEAAVFFSRGDRSDQLPVLMGTIRIACTIGFIKDRNRLHGSL